jgi:hypothetical protein
VKVEMEGGPFELDGSEPSVLRKKDLKPEAAPPIP